MMANPSKPKAGDKREGYTVSFAPGSVLTKGPFTRIPDDVDSHLSSFWAKQETVPPVQRPGPDPGADFC